MVVKRSTAIMISMTAAVLLSGLAQWAWSWPQDPPFIWASRWVVIVVGDVAAISFFLFALAAAITARDRDIEPRLPPVQPVHPLMARLCAEVGHSWMDLALGDRMCRNCGVQEDGK